MRNNAQHEKARKCFNEKIKFHIAQNFRYPEEALKMEYQGKISTMFKINEDGSIGNIKTKGRYKIL
ncbi:energy transducer TonB, partial [Maribacter sp.]|uniref:energy transducer TonB n=1 Tax=Maribacter sp. TaxID=1897614 RepID=UPI00344C8A55